MELKVLLDLEAIRDLLVVQEMQVLLVLKELKVLLVVQVALEFKELKDL
jgi:hypothetical protein